MCHKVRTSARSRKNMHEVNMTPLRFYTKVAIVSCISKFLSLIIFGSANWKVFFTISSALIQTLGIYGVKGMAKADVTNPNAVIETGIDLNTLAASRNYASAECAKVVETNPEAKKSFFIISESNDEYMLNPCKAKIWFVIELCEKIQATHIEMANYELFSSTPKDFTVYFSDVYPTSDWKIVGRFTATDARSLQAFDLSQVGFGKYIRVELHSHYRNEQYCPISKVKIYGISMVEDYDLTNNGDQAEIKTLNVTTLKPRPKRRTSAYRVYKNMIMEPYFCGLSRHQSALNNTDHRVGISELVKPDNRNGNQLQPFNPNQNRTVAPLKPSIFVELSNKYKKLEQSVADLRLLNEDMGRRLNETEWKLEKSTSFMKSNFQFLVIVAKAFMVYHFMLRLM